MLEDLRFRRNDCRSMSGKIFERYKRQVALWNFGLEGQERLKNSTVSIVGAGGVGSACIPLIAGAGAGEIRILDCDVVSKSNLHRQTMYRESDEGKLKVEVLAKRLGKLNSEVKILPFSAKAKSLSDLKEFLKGSDLCIDATDSFRSRLLVSEACKRKKIPLIMASAEEYTSQLIFFFEDFYLDSLIFEQDFKKNNKKNNTFQPIFPPAAAQSGIWAAGEGIKYLALENPVFPTGKFISSDFSKSPPLVQVFNIKAGD